jgi:PAS domain S-box-containing protein
LEAETGVVLQSKTNEAGAEEKTGQAETQRPVLKAELLTDIFTSSPIGIYIVRRGKFCFVNPELERISGYSKDELVGRDSLSIVFPEDRSRVRESAVQMLKGEISSPYQHRVIAKDGSIRWIIETVTSINYEGKRASLGYFMDDSSRELAKRALSLSEEKFQKAFRSSPEWFVITTLDEGFYIDVNQAFLRTTGYSRDEVVGRSSIELGIWVDPEERAEIVKTLREEGAVRDIERRFRMKSGEIRTVLWSGEVIVYGNEKCILALTRDITNRKEVEKERLKLERIKGVLETAGAASHELNQPLQFIFFLLSEMMEESPRSRPLQEMKRQFERLKAITRKLENITTYHTREYIRGSQIMDLDESCGGLQPKK